MSENHFFGRYKFLGSMAQLGTFDAVADLDGPKVKVSHAMFFNFYTMHW